MPLVQRVVLNSHSYGGRFFETPHSSNRLDDTLMGSTAGALEQLGLLADYAADIFKDLMEISGSLSHRLGELSNRSTALADRLPEITSFIDGSPTFLSKSSADMQREQFPATRLLDSSSMPRVLRTRYESDNVFRPPDLKELDSSLSAEDLQAIGGSLSRFYSNPNFIREDWLRRGEEELQALFDAKLKERKAKKNGKSMKIDEAEIGAGKQISKLNWKDSMKTSDDASAAASGAPRRTSVTYQVTEQPPSIKYNPVPTINSAASSAPAPPPPGPPTALPVTSARGIFNEVEEVEEKPKPENLAATEAPPAPSVIDRPPPPVPTAPAPGPPPAPAEDDDGPPSAPPPPPPSLFRPPPPPPPRPAAPPPIPVSPGEAPASGSAPPPPPPPPRQAMPTNNPILDQIRRGSILKKVEPVAKVAKQQTGGLFGGDAVQQILARRKQLEDIEGDSSDDDDADW